ncbi:MAG: cbb3-type cytochrome c oxidase subunit I [Candidatus Eremiobacteraeota bacterium]|nr:cbb3-type cytochrome c oxidase subunit I [Candidatus Eremiobacteraeota bacterium]
MSIAAVHKAHGGEHDHIHPPPTTFIQKYVFSLDAKVIGIQYMVAGFLFFCISGLLAEIVRTQLLKPGGAIISPDAFNGVYSLHGSSMVWMVIIPLATGGFGNFVMPLQIGARDVAFPWLNLLSFWLFPVAAVILFSSFLFGAPDAGWTEYAPISLQGPPGTNLWCVAIFLIGISSTMTGLNFMTTILKMRAPGMTFTRMPLFVWAQLATAALNMVATVALSAAIGALFLERVFNIPFYDPARGGSPVLWQHMFWFYSHPAVYIMILPAFGIISEVLPTFARKPIFGYKMLAFSTVAIALLGFMVWAHHMFTSGMAPWLQLPFMILTMVIAVPTGVKIFSWMATLWGGVIDFAPAMLFAIGFIVVFTFGGITGIFLSAVPVDLHLHGTYFIPAHIHYVLFGGSVLGMMAGLYFWWPKITGRMMNRTIGQWHFWLTFVSFNVTFLPMHWLGIMGMARRVAVYRPEFQFWNIVATIGSYVLAASTLLLIYNMVHSFFKGAKAGPNPWHARTLEWTIDSPPPYYNYKTIPAVLKAPYEFGEPLPYIGIEHDTPFPHPGSPAPQPVHV